MNKKGGRVTDRKQQYQGLCLAVNPPPFDKGGKGVGDLLDFVKSAKRLFKGKGDGDF